MMKKKLLITCFSICTFFGIAQTVPTPDHVIVLMLENKGYSNIIGSSNAPYLNSLVSDPHCALFSQSYGITHPSQPNYIALFSGSTQGVVNDNAPTGTPYTTCNLGNSLLTNGYTFKGYAEDLPAVGSLANSSGNYVQRHCPWTFWQGTGTNQLPTTCNQTFNNFPASGNYASLPTVSFIIPNLANDMHDPIYSNSTAISNGDTWLNNHIPSLVQWVKANNSLLIIQYDEDEGIVIGGITIGGTNNNIPTMLIGSMVQGGSYTDTINHYSVLRTIEDMYSLPFCDSSAYYQPITSCWIAPSAVKQLAESKKCSVYPVPATDLLNIKLNSVVLDKINVTITDISGRIIKEEQILFEKVNNVISIDTKGIHEGVYFLLIKGKEFNQVEKIVIER